MGTIKGGDLRVEDSIRTNYKNILEENKTYLSGYLGADGMESTLVNPLALESFSKYSENALIGITPDFVNQINNSIEKYIQNINSKLDDLLTNVEQGFKGDALVPAINKYVEKMIALQKRFISALENAEKLMIESVSQQYKTSDTNIADQISTDNLGQY